MSVTDHHVEIKVWKPSNTARPTRTLTRSFLNTSGINYYSFSLVQSIPPTPQVWAVSFHHLFCNFCLQRKYTQMHTKLHPLQAKAARHHSRTAPPLFSSLGLALCFCLSPTGQSGNLIKATYGTLCSDSKKQRIEFMLSRKA